MWQLCSAVAIGLALLATPARAENAAKASAGSCLVYIGTYTGPKSQGIYTCRLDLASGQCTPVALAAEVKSPSFLAVHPSRKFLYSVNEINDLDGKPTGGVSAFSIDSTNGKLKLLNQQSSQGAGPCHLIVDKTGQAVLVANYGGGSVAALGLESDGRLKESKSFIQHAGTSANPARQQGPHAHSINVDPTNRFAMAADLGLDKVFIYRLDPAAATLTPNDPPSASVPPGSGPRHFAFHPNGKNAYVINEILCTATAFAYDPPSGRLTELETISTLPAGVKVKPEYSTAEIQVHPSGKFVYGSNRGHDSITVFAVDESTGKLRYVDNQPTLGKVPRGFGIDPTGRYFFTGHQDSHTVGVSRIDPQTGRLSSTGQSLEVGSPVCVKFVTLDP